MSDDRKRLKTKDSTACSWLQTWKVERGKWKAKGKEAAKEEGKIAFKCIWVLNCFGFADN